MSTKYPSKIDDNLSLPDAIDNVTPIKAEIVNDLKNAIIAIESELGTKPSGVSATLKARLASIDSSISSINSIKIAQDLGGTIDNPLVIGLRGNLISSQIPLAGQFLYFNGLAWTPVTLSGGSSSFIAGGDLSGNNASQTVIKLQGKAVSSATPTDGYVLTWNNSANQWESNISNIDEVQIGANYGNYLTIPLSINNNSTSSNIFTNMSTFEFNKSLLRSAGSGTRTIKLKIIAETTGAEITVRIYNFTAGAAVTGTTLNSTSMINVLLETSDISSYLSTGSAIYNIQMSIDTVDPAENASLTYAALEIQWS